MALNVGRHSSSNVCIPRLPDAKMVIDRRMGLATTLHAHETDYRVLTFEEES